MEKYEYKDLSEEEVSGLVTKLEIRRYLSKFSDFSPDGNLTDIEDETSRSCANDAQLEIWKIVRETPQNKPRIINELIKKGIELDAKKFATTVEHSRKGERWMDPVATGLMIGETLAGDWGERASPFKRNERRVCKKSDFRNSYLTKNTNIKIVYFTSEQCPL